MNSEESQKAINKWALTEVKSIYERLFLGFANKTPVDTGRARAGWQQTAKINQIGDTGIISNDVPYIGWLEFGTVHTQPHHMVEATILEVKRDYQ